MFRLLRQVISHISARTCSTDAAPPQPRLGLRSPFPDREAEVYNLQKQPEGKLVLPGQIFGAPFRSDIVQRVAVWQLAQEETGYP
eukprot:EC718210.1.p1 GENE.EC718210.1~~EC718210.1.p1  ORF type:complete len:85 (+),score=0.40 EC718210.1:81-335(+)